MKQIIIAGGCFWGVEEYYRRLKGIEETQVGYLNATIEDITYEQVTTQTYDAIEAVSLQYNEDEITLIMILEHLFRIIDPTSLDKQGNDRGISYRVGGYYENEDDRNIIEDFVFKQESNYNNEIVFEVKPVKSFVKAEDYHQEYLIKNPTGYCHVDFSKIKREELK